MNTKRPKNRSPKLAHQRRTWPVFLFLIPAALILIILGVIATLFFRSQQTIENSDSPTSIAIAQGSSRAHSATSNSQNTATENSAEDSASDSTMATEDSSTIIKSIADLPKPINDGNYQPAEVAVQKTVIIDEPIYFTKSVENDPNQARGSSKVAQSGANGTKQITYNVKYNSKGQSLAVEKIKEEVTKAPVPEITKVGTSDYNLNTPPNVTYYFSASCLASTATESGCGGIANDTYNNINVIEVANRRYVVFIFDFYGPGTAVSPIAPIINNHFLYGGQSYLYEHGRVDRTKPLTEEICTSYGLACGRW